MKTLQQIFAEDRRARADSRLQEQDFRRIIDIAAPIFAEETIRGGFPHVVENDPGVLESAHLEVLDLGDALHGMPGTGGTFDHVGKKLVKRPAYAIWQNVLVPMREGAAARRGGFDILRESVQRATQKVVETENKLLVAGLGPVTGLTGFSGVQTFAAGAAWTTAGQAWKDFIKARGKLRTKKAPMQRIAILCHPDDAVNWYQTFSNTDTAQLEKLSAKFSVSVHENTEFTAGTVWVVSFSPQVYEYRVYQDLTVVPLPKVDEDERVRVRVIGALHDKKVDGIVKITGA